MTSTPAWPRGSGPDVWCRVGGLRLAKDLALTSPNLTSAGALAWGLVNSVVPDADLATEVDKLATHLAQGPTRAYGMAKRLIMEGTSASLETQMQVEAVGITAMMRTRDGREGIDAFVNKRKPEYTGE